MEYEKSKEIRKATGGLRGICKLAASEGQRVVT